MDEWPWRRWWLLGWIVVAALFVGQTVNRLSGAREFYDGTSGLVQVATWNLLVGAIESGFLSLGLLFIAVLPTAWLITGRDTRAGCDGRTFGVSAAGGPMAATGSGQMVLTIKGSGFANGSCESPAISN